MLLDIMHGSLTGSTSSSNAATTSPWLMRSGLSERLDASKTAVLSDDHRVLIEEVQEVSSSRMCACVRACVRACPGMFYCVLVNWNCSLSA